MTVARYALGDLVRIQADERAGHHRIPGYTRGRVGRIVAVGRPWPLPDDVVARRDEPRIQPVYTVKLAADALFEGRAHVVHVDLWEDYLTAVPDEEDHG